jgi:hypothetical protein
MAKISIAFLWCIVIILFASMPKEEEYFLDVVDNANGLAERNPRAAMILVATQDLNLPDPLESMKKSIRSILSHTDPERIFAICAVFQQGVLTETQQEEAQIELDKLDAGTSSHWHGTTKHSHSGDASSSHRHGQKIKAMFVDHNSVSASRHDAAQYIKILEQNHEKEGYKSAQEEMIAVFVRPDSEIETNHWVDTVSHALIGTDEENTSNAISFAASSTETISEGETKSATLELKPIKWWLEF